MDKEQWNPLHSQNMMRFLTEHSIGRWVIAEDSMLIVYTKGGKASKVKPGEWLAVHSGGEVEVLHASQ